MLATDQRESHEALFSQKEISSIKNLYATKKISFDAVPVQILIVEKSVLWLLECFFSQTATYHYIKKFDFCLDRSGISILPEEIMADIEVESCLVKIKIPVLIPIFR